MTKDDELTARDRAAFLLTLVCAYRRKRAVDGMNGRMWDGSVHLSAEREIDILEAQWLTVRDAAHANDLPTAEDVRGILCNEEDDAALETARDLLDQSICECGHCDTDHLCRSEPPNGECRGDDGACECRQFRGVEFTVARKPVHG